MNDTVISRATLVTLHQVVDLFDSYRQFYRRPSDLGAAREFLQARITQNESVIFIAYLNSQAVGFAQLYPIFSSVSLKRAFLLNDLFVEEKARRRNIASGLLNAAVKFACEQNAAWLTLSTAVDNETAQALYRREGWVREDEFYVFNFNCS